METRSKKRATAVGHDDNSTEIDEHFDSDISEKITKEQLRKGPITYEKLRLMSRMFHKNVPSNPFYKEKIPYKTIIIVNFNNS
jgi:hypothetical protein